MTRNTVCSECGGTMERGFVVESWGSMGIPNDASFWLEGKPEKIFWDILKTKGKQSYYITAYRCQQCGLLKFYAGPDLTNKN